jgi:predicted nucleotide-binding protein
MANLKNLELVQDLINRTQKLTLQDRLEKDLLLQETKMIIRNAFNNNEDYVNDHRKIRFTPLLVGSPTTTQAVAAWERGTESLYTLLSTMKKELEYYINIPEEQEVLTEGATSVVSRKVFVVHGHDDVMKLDVARTIETLGLEAIILHEQDDLGLTVIEKFEQNALNCDFAVVLLSPDDMGYSKDTSPVEAKFRARQNVILELGYFVGRLGRSKVLPLVKNASTGSLEIPSDYAGVVYTSYKGNWQASLLRYLKAAGYEVDANKLF